MSTFTTFNDLKLPPFLAQALEAMDFKVPTPIQAEGIPPALRGKDVLGIAPTGTGKTGAFGIPALAYLYPRPGQQVLVLAPTRELATQIFRFLRTISEKLDLKGSLLVGGESFSRQRAECKAGADFIVATPGRLMDHVSKGLSLGKVTLLVLDEVDRMLDMGFAPQVEQIVGFVPKRRQTFLFSATFPPAIEQLAARYLQEPVRIKVAKTAALSPQIHEEEIKTTDLEKSRLLEDQVASRQGKILIFANTQGRVEQVTRRLKGAGHDVVCIHAGRSNGERKVALNAFRRGEVRILVATDLVSRGIDVLDIEHVINFDYPSTPDDYLHRIGRTGRIGKSGQALTFIDEKRKPRPSVAKRVQVNPSSSAPKKEERPRRFPTDSRKSRSWKPEERRFSQPGRSYLPRREGSAPRSWNSEEGPMPQRLNAGPSSGRGPTRPKGAAAGRMSKGEFRAAGYKKPKLRDLPSSPRPKTNRYKTSSARPHRSR